MRVLSKPKHLLFTLLLLLTTYSTADAQNPHDIYDLRVGVERHYAYCVGLTGICPTGGSGIPVIEKVIDHLNIDGTDYGVVTLTGWTREYGSNETTVSFIDTSYYRMEGSVLYEHKEGTDIPVFDFGFGQGDSIMNIIDPYIENDEVENYGVEQQGVSSVILIDTLLRFNDGVYRNVLWGEDTLITSNGNIYPPPAELEFDYELWSDLPVPQYGYHRPFYYISGIGVILTPFNHHNRMMCGFKTTESYHFGCYAPQHTSSIDLVEIPTEKVLLKNYPNPFNPETTIQYTLSTPGAYRLFLYNSLGSLVTVLDEGSLTQGEYQYRLDMDTYASGVYFVVLEHSHFRSMLPITLIK